MRVSSRFVFIQNGFLMTHMAAQKNEKRWPEKMSVSHE